jgi:hypothetical protein
VSSGLLHSCLPTVIIAAEEGKEEKNCDFFLQKKEEKNGFFATRKEKVEETRDGGCPT